MFPSLPHNFLFPLLPSLLVCSVIIISSWHQYGSYALLEEQKGTNNNPVSAIFVFGDSTVDPGNNNFINTIAKSNFPPYGTDFPGHTPTGRFSNGRLATDFIASYLGIKDTLPPYLDPSLGVEDLVTGVSFASANSGYDPQTSASNGVIGVLKQLDYFREFRGRLEQSIGKARTQDTIRKALFIVSAGTNDLTNNFASPTTPRTYTVSAYQRVLLNLSTRFIQGLMEQGARNIAVIGVPPIGCIPVVITNNSPFSNPGLRRPCLDSLSSIAGGYNQILQAYLKAQQSSFAMNHTTVVYADIYNLINDYVKRPSKYGFEVVDRGCCGTGLLELSLLCNPFSLICSDRTKYVFWDAVHPTETTYTLIAESLLPLLDRLSRQ